MTARLRVRSAEAERVVDAKQGFGDSRTIRHREGERLLAGRVRGNLDGLPMEAESHTVLTEEIDQQLRRTARPELGGQRAKRNADEELLAIEFQVRGRSCLRYIIQNHVSEIETLVHVEVARRAREALAIMHSGVAPNVLHLYFDPVVLSPCRRRFESEYITGAERISQIHQRVAEVVAVVDEPSAGSR